MYAWSEFPYDNACEYDNNNNNDKTDEVDAILLAYKGSHLIKDLEGTIYEATVTSNDKVYTFCRQRAQGLTFQLPKFLNRRNHDVWRSNDQDIVVSLFAYTAVALLVFFTIQLIRSVHKLVNKLLYPSYKVRFIKHFFFFFFFFSLF